MSRAPLLALSALLGACSLTPPLPEPAIEVPSAWTNAATQTPAADPLADWWRGFDDPVLNTLVDDALAHNRELAVATARLREARAAAGSAASRLMPTLDARGSGGLRRDDLQAERLRFPHGAQSFHQLGVDASWEIDVFGAARAASRAATAGARAAAYGLADVQLSLVAEVAREYFALRGAQARLAVAQRNVGLQEEALTLLDSRVRAGLSPALDAMKARADLALLRGSRPPLEAAIAAGGYRLAVLTGAAPGALDATLAAPRALPERERPVPLALPSTLLSRRPDVKRSEAEVLAANERVGAARADLLPKFYLSGLLARAEEDNGGVSFGPGLLYSIGPTLRLPLFDGGRLRARIEIADARLAQALARHEHSMLVALQDVETALIQLERERRRASAMAEAVDSAAVARELAQTRYARGLSDYFAVIDAQRALQTSEDALAASRTAAALQLVALYKALGGGWDDDAASLAASSVWRQRSARLHSGHPSQ